MEQTMYHNTVKRGGISSSSLKIIAVISMLTDHFAAGVLGRYLTASGLYGLDVTDTDGVMLWMGQGHNMQLLMAYQIMRMIGRIAFPIYCFLLVEGFEHTKNRIKYAQRLLLFAAASEIPFDLLFKGKILEFGYQNVFFTLFFGLAVMMGLSWVQERLPEKGKAAVAAGSIAVIAAGAGAAQLLRTDYGAIGVMCMTVLFLFRGKKTWQVIAGCVVFLWELTAPLAFVPVWFYNGRRGMKLKYFFYLFYPVHLLVLYLICIALGIYGYSAM